jgi:hypothetical protein
MRRWDNWNMHYLCESITFYEVKPHKPYNLVLLPIGIYQRRIKIICRYKTSSRIFLTTLFTIVKIHKLAKCPFPSEWVKSCDVCIP